MNFNDLMLWSSWSFIFLCFPRLVGKQKTWIYSTIEHCVSEHQKKRQITWCRSLYTQKEHNIAICWCYLQRLDSPSFQMHEKNTLQFCNFHTLEKQTTSINKVYHLSYKYYLSINTVFHLSFIPRLCAPPRLLLIKLLSILLWATKYCLPMLVSPRYLQAPVVWCPVVFPIWQVFLLCYFKDEKQSKKINQKKQ